jgi:dienelactone hydrolase
VPAGIPKGNEPMRFTSQTTSNGVTERLFTLDDITGVIWSPANATGSHPLVLLGHGGGQHKKAAGVLARAHQYVTCGFAAAAIDAPGHGDRPPVERHQRLMADIRQRVADGEALGPHMAGYNVVLAAQAVPEWQATLDALLELDGVTGPVAYWGISMGGGIGVLLVAAESRISAAVLGLAGHETLLEAAGRISVPVEFVLQWDDEMVPRDDGLALFDALASQEKTLHANAGGHGDVPRFEVDSSVRFFTRHLLPGHPRGAAG